jgi:hypothetical protein
VSAPDLLVVNNPVDVVAVLLLVVGGVALQVMRQIDIGVKLYLLLLVSVTSIE